MILTAVVPTADSEWEMLLLGGESFYQQLQRASTGFLLFLETGCHQRDQESFIFNAMNM